MTLNAYLKLTGQTQGKIQGPVTAPGREGSSAVLTVEHEIVSPRDAASGLPTGKRMHHPITITKELDKASPLLYNLLSNNENITEWELQFWAPATPGTREVLRYSVKLTDAAVTALKFYMLNTQNGDLTQSTAGEEVSFTYRKIEWTWADGGISAADDWETPVA